MSKTENITKWLMKCPELYSLWNISALTQDGTSIIFPSGSSQRRNLSDKIDITGRYNADIIPFPSVYEEYQINCYKTFTDNSNDYNIMKYEDVERVIEWIHTQDENGNFPDIGKVVISTECFPFIPQIRAVSPDSRLICYYITLRITYINTSKERNIQWQIQ